jgi:hypothetical protein
MLLAPLGRKDAQLDTPSNWGVDLAGRPAPHFLGHPTGGSNLLEINYWTVSRPGGTDFLTRSGREQPSS